MKETKTSLVLDHPRRAAAASTGRFFGIALLRKAGQVLYRRNRARASERNDLILGQCIKFTEQRPCMSGMEEPG